MHFSRPSLRQFFNLLCYLYIALLLFPQTVFSNKTTHKNITVYYHNASVLDKDIKKVLEKAVNLLEKSTLYNNNVSQKIFLCICPLEYTLFSGLNFSSKAINHPFTNNIFISKSSVAQNIVLKKRNHQFHRALSSVIAHEIKHSFVDRSLGIITSRFKMPTWKTEGYSEYVAHESSIEDKKAWHIMCERKEEKPTLELQYFLFRKLTQEVLNNSKDHLSDWFIQKINKNSLRLIVQKKHCN